MGGETTSKRPWRTLVLTIAVVGLAIVARVTTPSVNRGDRRADKQAISGQPSEATRSERATQKKYLHQLMLGVKDMTEEEHQ